MSGDQHVHQHEGHDPNPGNESSDMGHMMMSMFFHTGTQETILFKPWDTDSSWKFAVAFVGIFFLAMFYEFLKFYREILYDKNSTPLLDGTSHSLLGGIRRNVLKSPHLIQTLLHMVQLVLSYFLMLIFMTYNVWLAVSITLGAGAGYLLFGWNKRTATDITEHCH